MIFPGIDPLITASIGGWFPPPSGLSELILRYGDIKVAMGQVLTPRWESNNMMMVVAPYLPADAYGRTRLYVNKQVWPMLSAALQACLALNDGYQIRTLGCFSPRLKRVNGDISVHSWGAAVDLNADTNPLSLDGKLVKDIPDAWIGEFTKVGFTWGGTFHKPDAMHFQFVENY